MITAPKTLPPLRPPAPKHSDLLHLLAKAHRRLDRGCDEVRRLPAEERSRLLGALLVDIAAHEAAEAELLHPLVADRLTDGERLVRERRHETELVTQLARRVRRLPPTDPRVGDALAALHRHLTEHTDREEIEIYPFLRHVVGPDELSRLGRRYAIRHAERCRQMGFAGR